MPLAEARLSTFLAADKDNTETRPTPSCRARSPTRSARYNLTNLVTRGNRSMRSSWRRLQRLCETVGVSADVATRIAIGDPRCDAAAGRRPGASAASAPTPPRRPCAADPPLMPASVRSSPGSASIAEALRALEPYVVHPARAQACVNVNTAPREVLVAAIAGLDLATAERIVQARQRAPLRRPPTSPRSRRGLQPERQPDRHVGSSFFEVRGRLRLGDVVLEQRSLVQRRGLDVVVLQRERVSSRDATGLVNVAKREPVRRFRYKMPA